MSAGPPRSRARFLAALVLLAIGGGAVAWFLGGSMMRRQGSRSPVPEIGEQAGPGFVDIAAAVGLTKPLVAGSPEKILILENIGSGAGILDFDLDGRMDLFFANAGPIRDGKLHRGPGVTLYRQREDGRFDDATAASGISFDGWGTGVAVGDIESDGDPDIFLGALGPPLLWRNEGNGKFTECARDAGFLEGGLASSAVFLDYDRDGRLDIYVARYVEFDFARPPNGGKPCIEKSIPISCGPSMHRPLPHLLYRNRGGGRFEDVTLRAGMGSQENPYGLGAASADIDGDGWPDIYAANDTAANFLWRNRRDGTFEDVALESGCALGDSAQAQSGMGIDIADANGDGRPDIVVSNYTEEYNSYWENLGGGGFVSRVHASGLVDGSYLALGWAAKFLDYDQDGGLDLFVVNGHVHPRARDLNPSWKYEQPILFYRGDGRGTFRRIDAALGPDIARPRAHRSAAVGDIDGDGDLDIAVTVLDAPPVLLQNRSGHRRRSIIIRLRGVASNREGIGARVELKIDGAKAVREISRGGGYLSSSDAAAHFGLGERERAEGVRIVWPSGTIDDVGAIDGGASYWIEEGGRVVAKVLHTPAREP